MVVNLFAMRYGGPRHCSALIGAQDFLSYSVRIPFAFFVGHLIDESRSLSAIGLILSATVVGHVCILTFLLIDQRRPPKPRLDQAEEPLPPGPGKLGMPSADSAAGPSSAAQPPGSSGLPPEYEAEITQRRAEAKARLACTRAGACPAAAGGASARSLRRGKV